MRPDRVRPGVTAIVLNWCNERDTAACLESLAASRYDALTVLLVDNGSPDGSGDRLHERFPDVPYLQTGSNLGYAAGNNRGMAWALERNADYLLVLNNDTVIDPACVSQLVETARASGASVVAPQIRYFDAPERLWYGGGRFSKLRAMGVSHTASRRAPAGNASVSTTFVSGCCFLIRADVIRQVGGFDELYFAYVEDAELSFRLARANYVMMYEPSALVYHRHRPEAADTPFQIRQRDRNRRRLVTRHYGAVDRLAFAMWFYPTRLLHLARFAVRLDWARARSIIEGSWGE